MTALAVVASLSAPVPAELSYYGVKAVQLKGEAPLGLQTCPLFISESLPHRVAPNDALFFSFGVRGSAGTAHFRVRITAGGKSETVFERTLHPKSSKADRGWQQGQLALARWSGREVKIAFESAADGQSWLSAGASAQRGFPWGGVRVGSFSPDKNKPNVVLISFDTLRADRISATGYPRRTTPNIDSVIDNGGWFTEAISQAPWTKPSHISIFTGLYPSFHAQTELSEMDGDSVELAEDVPTLTEMLRDNGYLCQAFTGSGYASARYGLGRGFDRYWETATLTKDDAKDIFGNGIDFIRENSNRRFFLFLHTFEIHRPYTRNYFVTPKIKGDADYLSAQYDSGVRFADEQFGVFLAELRKLGLDRSTVIVILSDHGEELADRGFWPEHGHSLYDDQIRVPLVIAWPGRIAKRTVPSQVQLIDVMPTLLDLLAIKPRASMQGKSLLPLLNGAPAPVESDAISESVEFGGVGGDLRSIRVVGKDRLKFIYSPSAEKKSPSAMNLFPEDAGSLKNAYWLKVVMKSGGREFYDLNADPGEKTNRAGSGDPRLGPLEQRLSDYFHKLPGYSPVKIIPQTPADPLDAELREKLRSLGY